MKPNPPSVVCCVFAVLVLGAATAGSREFRASEGVMDAQRQLKAAGHYYSEIDGLEGPETRAAIKRFQIREGLPVTGELDETTRTALEAAAHASTAAPAASPARTDGTETAQTASPPAPPESHPQADEPQASRDDARLRELAEADRKFLESQPGDAEPAPVAPSWAAEAPPPVGTRVEAIPSPPAPQVWRGIAVEPPAAAVYRGRVVDPWDIPSIQQ